MFIRNCWYVVAWDHEIPADGFLARRILDEPLLLWRTSEGRVVAIEDRCCHRHAPLSRGRREGDCVRCGYHGMLFDADGRCVEVPGMQGVPPKACVRRYPVVVHRRWVFAWMGDPSRADPDTLPDNFSCDDPGWRYLPGYTHFAAPHDLISDNLLDFSHLSFVHATTLGGSTAIAHSRPVIEPVPNGLRVSRRVPDVPPPAYYRKMRPFTGNIDRWFVYDYLLPGVLLMHSGGRPTDAPPGDESLTVRLHSCQAITPETAGSTHYFFQQAHPADQGDASITTLIRDALEGAFAEDHAMIAAQAANLGPGGTGAMLPLWMDSAILQFRRLYAEALAADARAPLPA